MTLSLVPAPNSCVYLEGPWAHRLVRANGCQFHLAHMGTHHDSRPLVLLVPGFPEYWWAWRHQIEPIATAGFEVAAIDVRGTGGSDKTPDIVDGLTLARDLPALARSLGAHALIAIGLGRGGSQAWAAGALDPAMVAGVLTFSAPHPHALQRVGTQATLKLWRHVATTFVPPIARRGLMDEGQLGRLIAEWSAPGNTGATSEVEHYAAAMRLPQAADQAVEQLRWSYNSLRHATGIEYASALRAPLTMPVWTVRGALDPLLPDRAWLKDRRWAQGHYRHVTVNDAGHFIPEEAPNRATELILEFLERFA